MIQVRTQLGLSYVDFPLYYQLASGIMQPLTYMVCGKNVLEIHQSPVKGCWKTAHVHYKKHGGSTAMLSLLTPWDIKIGEIAETSQVLIRDLVTCDVTNMFFCCLQIFGGFSNGFSQMFRHLWWWIWWILQPSPNNKSRGSGLRGMASVALQPGPEIPGRAFEISHATYMTTMLTMSISDIIHIYI